MKVDKIRKCICCEREANGGDSVYYGMPQLRVCGGKPNTYFQAFCPLCGCGDIRQFPSAFLALRNWNKIQAECERIKQGKGIFE